MKENFKFIEDQDLNNVINSISETLTRSFDQSVQDNIIYFQSDEIKLYELVVCILGVLGYRLLNAASEAEGIKIEQMADDISCIIKNYHNLDLK